MATEPKTVDSALWWDPFETLLADLEHASLSSDLPEPLAKRLKENHFWFIDSVARFKPPNEKSKEALGSEKLKIGSHELSIKPPLRDKALQVSSYLFLDEVQSYILVERCLERSSAAIDAIVQEPIHVVLLQYYIERQCLLKCTRQILIHALYAGTSLKDGNFVSEEARTLISDGLERKLISILEALLSSTHPMQMDVDLFTFWAEETLIEDNLVLAILFLVYYESFCSCNGENWKKMCSLYKGILSGPYNFAKFAVSTEALHSSNSAKVLLLLILIETLNLETLLQMVNDETPFRQGSCAFSLTDVQDIDSLISGFDTLEMKEAGPLVFTWAVFLCLITSLPGKEDSNFLMEIDPVSYVRQAIEAASLSYFLEILRRDIFKESDGFVAGYRSVLRTLFSAFIAAYDVNLQMEDNTLNVILEILCNIYRGEESLCVQFWDRGSFIDGPIRCLLCNLEGEFPLRTRELVRLLSSLSEGSWPAECVYNYLDKSVGLSSLFEISSESLVDNASQIVETHHLLHIPGFDGLYIPSGTRGRILKEIGGNTAIVRWEYSQSAIYVLLLRLAQSRYLEGNEEVILTLDLLCRMVSFKEALSFALIDISNSLRVHGMGTAWQMENNVWVIEILSTIVRNLSPNPKGASVTSMVLVILGKMLKCLPSHVAAVVLKGNIFDVSSKAAYDIGWNGLSSGSWLFSSKLAKMLLIDSEQNDYDCPLAVSVLDFILQLVKTGLEDDAVLSLIGFSLQYIFVNHEYWKYKAKSVRWKVTSKVLELMKACIMAASFSEKLGEVIKDMLLCDSSIHNVLFRIVCTNSESLEKLYVNRLIEPTEIEGLQLAISSALDVLYDMLSNFSKDVSLNLPVFHQALLSSTTKPIPVVAAVISLMSYFRDPAIQLCAAKLLSMLLYVADCAQPYLPQNSCFGLNDKQITELRHSVSYELLEQLLVNQDLFLAFVDFLTSAACYQPAFLVALFAGKEDIDVQLSYAADLKQPRKEASSGAPGHPKPNLMDSFLYYIERSADLIDSNPRLMLSIANFLKALWKGACQFIALLEQLKTSKNFLRKLCDSVSRVANSEASPDRILTELEALNFGYKYQFQSAVLEIMACDMFMKKKLLFAESLAKEASESGEKAKSADKSNAAKSYDLEGVFLNWSESSVLRSLIKTSAYTEYDNGVHFRAKIAASLLIVHLMGRLLSGNAGSLCISLLEKVRIMSEKLFNQSAFSELLVQYSQHGYSQGKELKTLIISDLYYQLEGELEGRKISPGPFRELSQFLVGSEFLQFYKQRCNSNLFATAEDLYSFDLQRIRADMGLDMWVNSEWKASKSIVDAMLCRIQDANSRVLITNSKLSALKALITVFTVYMDDSLESKTGIMKELPDQIIFSCIDLISQSFNVALESLAPFLEASKDLLEFVTAQAQLLLHLLRSVKKSVSKSVCLIILKTSASGLKVLSDISQTVSGAKTTIKILVMLSLLAMEFSCLNSQSGEPTDKEGGESFADISNLSLGILPILCKIINIAECCTLSLTAVDLILKTFLTPDTWLPIIQKHLQLQHLVLKLQDQNSVASYPNILRFFLTIASVSGGAEMLINAGFFSSVRVLFADFSDGRPPSFVNIMKSSTLLNKLEKPQQIWGLGLAVVTAIVRSLGDSSLSVNVVDNVIQYFFSEKANLIFYYLSAPEFPSDDQDKKRPRAKRTKTSLSSLKDTEHTLMLMCVLARHWSLWIKATKEMDSPLREVSIHLLAFISRGTQRLGESPSRNAPLLCPPNLKEELDNCKKPSFVNSRNGWFALSPLGCVLKTKLSVAATTSALVIKDQATESINHISQSHFSDSVAIQIYKITFLLLKFLCIHAEVAAKRAEELGFVDLAHFPELPMPEILHGLQDQAIFIVRELCETNRLKQIHSEVQYVCLLLSQILEMALYLELCVLQICGIRPVLGRVEDFSKEVQLLINATEGHAFLKTSVKSLKQIIALIYPGLP